MPVYYDEQTKSWYCKFYYTDYTGAKKQKKSVDSSSKEKPRNGNETFWKHSKPTYP